ncbi:MAG TPA: ABC transporter substrate-binding protein, partial [Chloroflexota bacterium]|nr:ABC transporter substrate-binding protein [Chloroflexota bacterium]
MNAHLRHIGIVVVIGLAVAACGGGGAPGAVASHPTLVVDVANAPANLDPGLQYNTESYVVYRNIFDTLVRRDPVSLKIVPWVADSWKQSTPTTWEFTIHKGITFQDGSPLTAADVAFSLNRILDKSFNSPQLANFNTAKMATASGDVTTIETFKPSPVLLSFLTTLAIVPEKYVTAKGAKQFNLEPIGSGPYQLKTWQQGTEVDLDANPTYWKGKPTFDHVVFRNVPTASGRVADLQSGKADFAFQLSPDDAGTIKAAANLQVFATPTERVGYIALNVLGNTPTKSLQLRQAIGYAIDYGSLIKNLLKGYGKPVTQVLTPLSFGYDKDVPGFTYDLAKAQQILASAGLQNVSLTFDTSPSYDPNIIQAVQADLKKAGINVTISNTDQATFLKKVQSPDHTWGSIRFGRWSCSC